MFDIVAAHQHELALPVEVECVDDGEPRLALPTAADHVEPPAEDHPPQPDQHKKSGKERDDRHHISEQSVVAEKITEELHTGRVPLQYSETGIMNSSMPRAPLSQKVKR